MKVLRRCGAGVALTGAAFIFFHPDTKAEIYKAPTVTSARPAGSVEKIWMVEQRQTDSVYSNGLQIRAESVTQSVPRSYRSFARVGLAPSAVNQAPAGIVFHTTESLQLPLEAGRNQSLIQTRADLLRYIRNKGLYNFLVDRFGQVFRIVPEAMVAHHAGHSVWADAASVYVDLNESFIGVAFEARTETSFAPNAAQIRAGRMLTDFLRAQYRIPESNCVTHAQVSVNPDNMRVGLHTDWAANFPFRELGLSGGYSLPVAAIEIFGFDYDPNFLDAIGGWPWQGMIVSEQRLAREAEARGKSPGAYRQFLQQQYRTLRSHYHGRTEERDRA